MNAESRIRQAILALTLAVCAGAIGAEDIRRLGILYTGRDIQRSAEERTFLETLRDKGFVEGRNLVVTRRYADGDVKRLGAYAKEIEAAKPEVVLTMCTPSTRAMSQASSSIPIVMGMVSDPVGQQLVASLARPGRNITGTANQYDEMLPKMLEVLASVLPKGARVGVLAHQTNVAHHRLWPIAEAAAKALQIRVQRYELKDPGATQAVLDSMLQERMDAIFVLPDDPVLSGRRALISEFALQNRLPTLYSAREFAESGGLMSYGTSLAEGYRQAGLYVNRILRGERPERLPVSLPMEIELTINMKTARAIGVKIPEVLRLRAERVIE